MGFIGVAGLLWMNRVLHEPVYLDPRNHGRVVC